MPQRTVERPMVLAFEPPHPAQSAREDAIVDEPRNQPPELDGVTYRQDMGRAAFALSGAGFRGCKIPDLGEKLDLFRAMAGLTHVNWSDAALASFLFGGSDLNAASTFNKKKRGNVALTAEDGAALAQLLNALGGLLPKDRTAYVPARQDRIITTAMVNTVPGNSGLTAADLDKPLHEFIGQAATALAATQSEDEERQEKLRLATVHVRLMHYLNGLGERAHPTLPVTFQRRREEDKSLERFGDAQQRPDLRVWDWEPVPLTPNERLVVSIGAPTEPPCELWAVTVRDPRPASPYGVTGPYAWNESWDRLVRWTVPARTLETGDPGTINFGRVVDLRGEYSLFVLADRSGEGRIRKLIGGEFGKPVAMGGFFDLLRQAADTSKQLGFDCYVRRYRVMTG